MYKGRGSTNEKMMRGIPGRGREQARERVPEKVEREAQLIFMCLQKKLNKSREKDEGENGSETRRAGREHRGEQRDSTICFNDFIFTFSNGGKAESKEKTPKEKLRQPQSFRRHQSHLGDERSHNLFVCFAYEWTGGGDKRGGEETATGE